MASRSYVAHDPAGYFTPAMPVTHPQTAAASHQRSAPAVIILSSALVVFTLFIALLATTALSRRSAVEFAVTSTPSPTVTNGLVRDTVTIDARDEFVWQFFGFAAGRALPIPDTTGWDLAFRRFVVVSSGRASDMGALGIDSAAGVAPGRFEATVFGRDTINPALERWYEYNFLSHLLDPNGHTYIVETRDGRRAALQFLSYYCPELIAGCVTFRYVVPAVRDTTF